MDQSVGVLIAIPFILLMMYFRMRRMSRARPLKVERMWIIPAIFTLVIAFAIWGQPPEPGLTIYVTLGLLFLVGIVAGWFRGRFVRIAINVETHDLTSQQSPWGMLIFVGILVVRFGARYFLALYGSELHLPVAAITDGLLLFYGGMIIGLRIEMWVRARKLLAEAIAAKAAGQAVPAEVSQDHA